MHADRTRADAPALEGAPAAHDGFRSALGRALRLMPEDEVQVYLTLKGAVPSMHEEELLARLKREDPVRWRRRSVLPVLRRLRRTLEGTGRALFDGERYWCVGREIKPAVRVEDLGPPSDLCGAMLRAIAMGGGKAGA